MHNLNPFEQLFHDQFNNILLKALIMYLFLNQIGNIIII